MKTIYTALIFLFTLTCFAQNGLEQAYYPQMLDINAQWAFHKDDCPKEQVVFASDIDAIQSHLYLVCESLLKNTPKHLSEKQLAKRLHLIEVLHDYAEQKIFPTNLYHSTRTPYFVDDFGVHCAVGYLMAESGYTDLVATIRANENYAYIAEIKTPGVVEWAGEHGFDLEELKWIQPGYPPAAHLVAGFGNGINGTVKKMASYGSNGLIFVGEFDTVDIEPCLNIGVYKENQISCLGQGLEGLINDIFVRHNKVYVLGRIHHENIYYSVAIFDGTDWEFLNIPGREGAIAKTGYIGGISINPYFDLVIENPDNYGVDEIWSRVGANQWNHSLTISGKIKQIGRLMGNSYTDRIIVGKFDEVTIHSAGDLVLPAKNILFFDGVEWSGYQGNAISDTVNTFVHVESQILFGGTASFIESSNGVLLSRYLNNVFQPVVTINTSSAYFADTTFSINALSYLWGDAHVTLGGSLLLGNGFNYGNNIGTLNLATNVLSPYAILNGSVLSIVTYEGTHFFGGEFTTNSGYTTNNINRFARIGPHLGIDNESQENNVAVYPNPFTDIIKVQGINIQSDFRILDTHGRVIHQGTIHGESTIDLSDLSSGVYMLHVMSDSGNVVRRIVKQ